MLNEALKQVAVIGAAGKMGSGISLLLLQEMSRLEAEQTGQVGSGAYCIKLIDVNEDAERSLRKYLHAQILRYAEKNINVLRGYFAENPALISNEEIIRYFVEGACENIHWTKDDNEIRRSSLIFEAIHEDIDLKVKVLSGIHAIVSKDAFFFTNTSSIPIDRLSEKSGLQGRLIGYHFYNPPSVQRLLEIIPAEDTNPKLIEYAEEIAKRLGKVVVFSKDVAGFIGNGHFIRDIDYACSKVRELEKDYTPQQAIMMVNRVTQDLMIRPMGIFQLIDYVGLDVCHNVMRVMSESLDFPFDIAWVDRLLEAGIRGGQHSDGSQKDGIFQYEKGRPQKVFAQGKYVDTPDVPLGDLPSGHVPWAQLNKDRNKSAVLEEYFSNLFRSDTLGARMAQEHLLRSREIARNLVKDGVAKSVDDVNTVLMNGFYHLYGADNAWIPEEIRSGS